MLFSAYQELLLVLVSGGRTSSALRRFELTLLTELGYGITFDAEFAKTDRIIPDRYYHYVPDEGFHSSTEVVSGASYKGEYLLAIAAGDLDSAEVDSCAKKVIRASLAALLGEKPLILTNAPLNFSTCPSCEIQIMGFEEKFKAISDHLLFHFCMILLDIGWIVIFQSYYYYFFKLQISTAFKILL